MRAASEAVPQLHGVRAEAGLLIVGAVCDNSRMSTADAASALGHFRAGRYEEAGRILRRIVASGAPDSTSLHLLGLMERRAGRPQEALSLLRSAAAAGANDPALLCNLAMLYGETGDPARAIDLLMEALRLRPNHHQAYNNLGVALEALGRLSEAERAHRNALRLCPAYADSRNNLGNVLRRLGRVAEAIDEHERAIALAPLKANAHLSLAAALQETGRVEDAVRHVREALRLEPRSHRVHDALLLALHFLPGEDPAASFEEHLRWARRHAQPLRRHHPHRNDRTSDRRLRVGYVSPDFRNAPPARFFRPLLAAHDRQRVEVFCYSDAARTDAVTEALRQLADEWRDTATLDDSRFAEAVEADRIDVLVDLTGHMEGNRLRAFARAPAPVQMTYLAYPDTTAVPAIGYRLTDSFCDPPGQTDAFHTERLVRLDPCCFSYWADDETQSLDIGQPPSDAGRGITFGVLQKPAKMNSHIVTLWSRILAALPDSRLLVMTGGSEADRSLQAQLERNGIPTERLVTVRRAPRLDYLKYYQRIDIALDTFPYSGHTTTCDALWMGVPVVTLAGKSCASRVTAAFLSVVGLRDLIAETPDRYVKIAVDLAADAKRLRRLRSDLRPMMMRSALMDPQSLAERMEKSFFDAWSAWCASTVVA